MSEGACRVIPAERVLIDRVGLDEGTLASIRSLIAIQRTLEDVSAWALRMKPPRIFEDALVVDLDGEKRSLGFDVVVQDEYTHDVTVPYDTQGKLYLVYDTT